MNRNTDRKEGRKGRGEEKEKREAKKQAFGLLQDLPLFFHRPKSMILRVTPADR